MSFREELANIMAESANIVYTEQELQNIKTLITSECKKAAKKGFNYCTMSNTLFFAARGDHNIYPRNHPQIMQIFRDLELDVTFNFDRCVYDISWMTPEQKRMRFNRNRYD